MLRTHGLSCFSNFSTPSFKICDIFQSNCPALAMAPWLTPPFVRAAAMPIVQTLGAGPPARRKLDALVGSGALWGFPRVHRLIWIFIGNPTSPLRRAALLLVAVGGNARSKLPLPLDLLQ